MSERAVLFDVDGTLVDSNYLHVLAWRRALLKCGEPQISSARIHRLVGMGTDELLETLFGGPRPDLKRERTEQFDALKPEIRAFPRAGDLLRALHGQGVRIVLATSAEKSDLDTLLEAIGADDAIDAVTSAGEVEAAKPHPDLFCAALEEAGTAPEATVVVGDTVWDVTAAERAGLPCVAVLSGGISRAELEDAGAVAVYDDVAALFDELDQSPLLGSVSDGTRTASSSRRTE